MQNANTKKKNLKQLKSLCIEEGFYRRNTERCQSKKALLVARDRSTQCFACKCRKVCMHTETEKENKTASPEDSTVKLITSLFLLRLENALKPRKQNKQEKNHKPNKSNLYAQV